MGKAKIDSTESDTLDEANKIFDESMRRVCQRMTFLLANRSGRLYPGRST